MKLIFVLLGCLFSLKVWSQTSANPTSRDPKNKMAIGFMTGGSVVDTASQTVVNETNAQLACAQKCEKYTETDVCFVSKDVPEPMLLGSANLNSACQGIKRQHILQKQTDIASVLIILAQQCFRVKKMVLHGHGNKSLMVLGDYIHSDSWKYFVPDISCVFSENAHIDLRSCNVGAGCDGQQQLYRMAQAFFRNKNGSIQGPTQLAVGTRMDSVKPVSINFKDRTVKYLGPNKEPVFGYDGLLLSTKKAVDVCLDELKDMQTEVDYFDRKISRYSCGPEKSGKYFVEFGKLKKLVADSSVKLKSSKSVSEALTFNGNLTLSSIKNLIEVTGEGTLVRCLRPSIEGKANEIHFLRKELELEEMAPSFQKINSMQREAGKK